MRPIGWRAAGGMQTGVGPHAVLAVLGLAGALHFPVTLAGQVSVKDFVISAGVAGEAWRGDFAAITVPQIDSTESAFAGVGEWSVNGILTLLSGENHGLETTLDAGFRQFATGGFRLRNYAPREHTGLLTTTYTHKLGGGRFGTFNGKGTARIRGITDRPPMPLYLSPGYETYRVAAGYQRSVRAVDVDVTVTGEDADYTAPTLLPKLDLLDRRSLIVEAGGSRRFFRTSGAKDYSESQDYSGFRFFGAYRHHSYPKQGEGIPRVDHAIGLGGTYELNTERLLLKVALDGTRSRSSSRRVEYNAGRLEAEVQLWALWEEMDLNLRGTLARKRYIDPGQHALVPGEEADNESSLYAEITRSLGRHVDGAFRLGWQRVETNFNGAYYTRFGGAFFLRVRPTG